MMGLGVWIVAGIAAFALARLVPFARGLRWIELAVAVTSAFLSGLAATALDFGGWAEPDVRAGVFAFLAATVAVALIRLIGLLRNRLKPAGKPETKNQKPEKRTPEKETIKAEI